MPWANVPKSERAAELPADWPQRRAETLRDDGGRCRKCGRPGNHVDHIIPGNDHSRRNRQTLCESCHMHKTAIDGNAKRRRMRQATRRKVDRHPGMT